MTTLTDEVENQLREEIVTGQLAPASRLQMDELRARYSTGGSPIREALSRLSAEGLVVLESNKGFKVPSLSRDDLRDIAQVRAVVEAAAIRQAIALGDEAWEARVVGALHRYRRASERDMSDDQVRRQWEVAHDDLHAALIEACASPRLLEMQKRFQQQHVRYRRLITGDLADAAIHVKEHGDLAAAVLARDAELAAGLIHQHMMLTADALDERGYWLQPSLC